jgi:hypothetical protein
MKRIVVKEIDRLKSSTFDDKIVSEYLIYFIINQGGEDIILKGFTEYGEKNKNSKIDEIILENFTKNELTTLTKENIIEELSFFEPINK